jgi:hypothetical protein
VESERVERESRYTKDSDISPGDKAVFDQI